MRTRFLFSPGMTNRISSPARGVHTTMLSRWCSIISPRYVIAEKCQEPDHHVKRIRLYAPRLQHADRVRKRFHQERGEPHRPIDNPGVPPDREPRDEPRQPSRA